MMFLYRERKIRRLRVKEFKEKLVLLYELVFRRVRFAKNSGYRALIQKVFFGIFPSDKRGIK
jgi:hypothetical protein